MTTFISLAASATMFPLNGMIRCSALTPELVKARMEKVQVVSALNPSHATTIDAIRRRFDLELPLPPPGPAPKVALQPGDELFIAQATLPRLKEGEVHSQATVDAAPISFVRWRVPVRVDVKAPEGPHGLSQTVFDQVIDHAHSIALWQRGQSQLKDVGALNANFADEVEEFNAAWSAWCDYGGSQERGNQYEADVHLEWADMAYYALCLRYQGEGDQGGNAAWWQAMRNADENIDPHRGIDIMLAKYARRAAGHPKDIDAERELAASILGYRG